MYVCMYIYIYIHIYIYIYIYRERERRRETSSSKGIELYIEKYRHIYPKKTHPRQMGRPCLLWRSRRSEIRGALAAKRISLSLSLYIYIYIYIYIYAIEMTLQGPWRSSIQSSLRVTKVRIIIHSFESTK